MFSSVDKVIFLSVYKVMFYGLSSVGVDASSKKRRRAYQAMTCTTLSA
jgi:hypothetical protein